MNPQWKARNNMISLKRCIFASTILVLIAGCAAEQNFRGVPAPTWEHLSAEQKQLIVDKTYQDDIKKTESGNS